MSKDLIKNEERKMLQDIVATQIKKENFIREIVGGLGDEIIAEPSKPQKKLSFWGKIKRMFLK